jgi:hypothetical protein
MYPPRVSTAQVQAVIRELTVEAMLPAGAALRRELHLRFGARCGVARIYRILAAERRRLAPVAKIGSFEDLQRELAAMRDRAERAEAREEAHQSRWAAEVDRLRMRLQALESETTQVRRDRGAITLLRHQLQAAEQRAAAFEEQVIALQRREPG